MKKFFLLIFIVCFTCDEVFSAVAIVSLLPNPTGDDTLGEYIELENMSCENVDIGHYSLSDLSGKSYIIPEASTIGSHEKRQFPYTETKITLNNSGEESIFLKDKDGRMLDTFSYSGTQKENVVLSISFQDESCSITDNTGSFSFTGEIFESGSLESTGSIFGSGESFSGYLNSAILTGSIVSMSGVFDTTGVIISDTGIILSDSGMFESNSGTVYGGGTFEFQTGSFNNGSFSGLTVAATGKLIPEWLFYSDTDNNHKIDTLEIIYNKILTGTIYLSQIQLSSKTGGISNARIDTATGYFVSGFLSGNTLILKMEEGDIEKLSLKISNSVFSDLRIKSFGILGISSLDGESAENFYLTTSFDGYKNVASRGLLTNLLSGSGETNDKDSSGITLNLNFPEIIPTLQSPTNAQFSSGVFICTLVECRINMTLEPLFQSGISQKDYICSFATGTSIPERDSDCNPNTYYFSGSGSITIEIISRNTGEIYVREFPVLFSLQNNRNISQTTIEENDIPDTGKPVIVLAIDGKWKEYYEQLGDYEMNCYAFTCSLNFTAEKSYDPEGSQIHFLWIYGRNEIKTTKDPGAIHYELGDHRLILRVIDTAGNYDEIIYLTHVLGPKQKQSKAKTETKKVNASLKKISKEVISVKKKYRKIKMEFFSQPGVILQGKTGQKIQEGKYRCIIKTAKTCSLNFTITGALVTFDYKWTLDGVEVYKGRNPSAWKLKPGNHSMILQSYRKGSSSPLSKQEFSISVVVAPKKTKKASVSSKKLPKKNLTIIPSASALNNETQETNTGNVPLAFFLLSLGLGFGYILKGRKKGNHSS